MKLISSKQSSKQNEMISLCLPSPNRIHMFTYFMRLIAGLGHRFRSENPFASIKEWNFINQSNNEIVWGSFVIILIKKWDTIEIIAKSSLKRWENNYSCIVFEKNRRRNRTIPELFKSFFQTWAFWIRMLNEGKQEQENIESCVCIEILSFRHGHLMMLSCHSSGKQHVFLFLNAGSFPFSSCFLSTVTNHICIIYKWKVMLMPLNAWMGKLSMLQNTNDKWQQKRTARLILMDVFGEWNTLRRMALNIGPFF